MKTPTTPDYSLDDIIFEGRHQAYGAYALRKAYPQHIKRATTYMFAAVGLTLAAARLGIIFQPDPDHHKQHVQTVNLSKVIMPKVEEKIVEQPTTTKPATKVGPTGPTRKLVTTQIVPDHVTVTEEMPDQTDFTDAEPGLADALGKPATDEIMEVGAGEEGASSITGESDATVFEYVENMPEFPGGMKQMYEFIRRTLRYPSEAQRLGLEGIVVVTFVVGKTGEISDIKVLKDVGGGTAEEATRVICSMKPWQPGRQNGQPVPVRFTLPLRFSLAS